MSLPGRPGARVAARTVDHGEVCPPGAPAARVVLRAAGEGDLAALAHLDRVCFPPGWSVASWRAELAADDRIWRLATIARPLAAPAGPVARVDHADHDDHAGPVARVDHDDHAGPVDRVGHDDHAGPVDRVGHAEVVGFAGLWLAPDAGHVLRLGVAPAHRRRGLGGRLVAALIVAGEDAGAPAHTLEVRASNTAASSLYRRQGFVAAGRRPGYYPDGEDALILWRDGAARAASDERPSTDAPPADDGR